MLKSVKVKDYMTTNLVTFKGQDDLFDAIRSLLRHHISGAPVVGDAGELVGIISESDCLKHILSGSYYEEIGGHVSDYMTRDPETITDSMDIIEVARRFLVDRRRRFPVVNEEGELVGQISRRDVLRAVADFNTADSKPKEAPPRFEGLRSH